MPTAIYKLADGTRVPSVTTINKVGQESGGLIHWAWEQGVKGMDYRKVRDDAAAAGAIGHLLMQAAIERRDVRPEDFPTDGARDLGMCAFAAYKRWRDQSNINWVDSELALVSEEHRYGGTIDAIGIENGSNSYCLGDWKTGGLYADHLCQIAGYAKLFEECTGYAVHGAHLCRFNRDTGDFIHAYFGDLEDAWEAFLLKRRLYDKLALLKKRV